MNVFGGSFQLNSKGTDGKRLQQPRLYFENTFEKNYSYSFENFNCFAAFSDREKGELSTNSIQKSACGRFVLTGHFRLDYRDELGDKLGVRYEELKRTDDVVLAMMAFEKWGIEFVSQLEGDWAFVLFDEQEKQLSFFRDPIGAGAIFYYEHRGFLYFSSDPRMFNCEDFQLRLDPEQFFKLGLKSGKLDDGKTVIRGLKALKKGEVLRADQRLVKLRQYPLFIANPVLHFRSDEDYIAQFKSTYAAAVRTRLGKGKTGLFLSAGLDSSMLCYFASRELLISARKLNTYTSYPKFIHLFSQDKQERIREDVPASRFVSQFSNVEPRFLNFSNMDMADMFRENEPFQLVRCLVKPNSFWIHGIFSEAKAEDVSTMMIAKMSNYTVSWDAPTQGLHYFLNFKFRLLYFFLRELSGDDCVKWLKSIKNELLLPFRRECQLFLRRLLYQIKGFNNISNVLIKHKFNLTDFLKWDFKLQFVPGFTSSISPKGLRKKIFSTLIDQLGIFSILDGLNYGVTVVDPSADRRLVQLSFNLPEKIFFQCGKRKFLYRSIMDGLFDEQIIDKKATFPQSYDIGLRLFESKKVKCMLQDLQNDKSRSLVFEKKELISDFSNLKRLGVQTDGLFKSRNILRVLSLNHILNNYELPDKSIIFTEYCFYEKLGKA